MGKFYFLLGLFGLIFCQVVVYALSCDEMAESEGTVSFNFHNTTKSPYNKPFQRCWIIKVPANRFIKISDLIFTGYSQGCTYQNLKINAGDSDYTFCNGGTIRYPIIGLKDVSLSHNWISHHGSKFSLKYEIKDIGCLQDGSFKCSNSSCIPSAEVCDGVEDCENGSDEALCVTGIVSMPGVSVARSKAIEWLKSRRSSSWGWQENTPRAVIALFLANGAKFDGSKLEDELMAKQAELKTSIALLRNPLKNELLSGFINSLLVTCHDPKSFFGQNLVDRLKKQIESSEFAHPMTYLTLCNANESWPVKALSDMKKMLTGNATYAFARDYQAFAVIALSCYENRTELFSKAENANLKSLYERTIQQFKEHQLQDGSFGNVHSTALVTQALISSDQEERNDWKLTSTVQFLVKQLNSTDIDFLATYLIMPILNGKSLSDISKVNCTANPRKNTPDGIVSQINDYNGEMMQIQYSLYVGDEKDVVHTIFLRVPQNFTANEVMKLAQVEDQKYNFEWKSVSGKMYVYRIGNVINDPEAGSFWLMYLGKMNSTDALRHSALGPDKQVLENNDHLVMWYRRALY